MKEKDDSSFNKSNADHSAFNASLLSKNYLLARRSEKESLDSLDMKAIKKTKKIKRYIIGFIFFIFYILYFIKCNRIINKYFHKL